MGGGNFWGGLIKSLRQEQNVSQRVLSAEANVNRSTLRRIEAGRTPGDIDMMERIFDYLGYELEALSRDEQTRARQLNAPIEVDPKRRSKLAARRVLSMRLQ